MLAVLIRLLCVACTLFAANAWADEAPLQLDAKFTRDASSSGYVLHLAPLPAGSTAQPVVTIISKGESEQVLFAGKPTFPSEIPIAIESSAKAIEALAKYRGREWPIARFDLDSVLPATQPETNALASECTGENVALPRYGGKFISGNEAARLTDGHYDLRNLAIAESGEPFTLQLLKPYAMRCVRLLLGGENRGAEPLTDVLYDLVVEGTVDGENWFSLGEAHDVSTPGWQEIHLAEKPVRQLRVVASALSTIDRLFVAEIEALSTDHPLQLGPNLALLSRGASVEAPDRVLGLERLHSIIEAGDAQWRLDSDRQDLIFHFLNSESFSIGAVSIEPAPQLEKILPSSVRIAVQSEDSADFVEVGSFNPEPRSWSSFLSFPSRKARAVRVSLSSAPGMHEFAFSRILIHEAAEDPRILSRVFEPTTDFGGRNLAALLEGAEVLESTAEVAPLFDSNPESATAVPSAPVIVEFFRAESALITEIRILAATGGGTVALEKSTDGANYSPAGELFLPANTVFPRESFSVPLPNVRAMKLRLAFKDFPADARLFEIEAIEGIVPGYVPIGGVIPRPAGLENIALGARGTSVATTEIPNWPARALIDGQVSDEGGYFTATPGWAAPFTDAGVDVTFILPALSELSGIGISPAAFVGRGYLGEQQRLDAARNSPALFSVSCAATDDGPTVKVADNFKLHPSRQLQYFPFPNTVSAKKVVLHLSRNYGGSELHLGEVELYRGRLGREENLLDYRLGATISYFSSALVSGSAGSLITPESSSRSCEFKSNEAEVVFAFEGGEPGTLSKIVLPAGPQLNPSGFPQSVSLYLSESDDPFGKFAEVVSGSWKNPSVPLTLPVGKKSSGRFLKVKLRSKGEVGAQLAGIEAWGTIADRNQKSSKEEPGAGGGLVVTEVEQNNDPVHANPVQVPGNFTGDLSPSTDKDFFAVQLDKSASVKLELRASVGGMPQFLHGTTDADLEPFSLSKTSAATLLLPAGRQLFEVKQSTPHIALVVDTSGSMDASMSSVQDSLRQFLRTKNPNHRVAVYSFSDRVSLLRDFTENRFEIQTATDGSLDADGGTALFEALSKAFGHISEAPPGPRAVILLSDGADSVSKSDYYPAFWHALLESGARFYPIALGDDFDIFQESTGSRPAALLDLAAQASGGKFLRAPRPEELIGLYQQISADLESPPRYDVELSIDNSKGQLQVKSSPRSPMKPPVLELILDVSGSMRAKTKDGKTRWQAARDAVRTFLKNVPKNMSVGLRVYGHRVARDEKVKSCADSELLVPPSGSGAELIEAALAKLSPRGQTPIGYSLRAVEGDLKDRGKKSWVVLITDGEESCATKPEDADYPERVVKELRQRGLNLTFHIVGLGVSAADVQGRFRTLASQTGGSFSEAGSTAELEKALGATLARHFTVTNGLGQDVATGVIDAGTIELAAGSYQLKIEGEGPRSVIIEPGKTTMVEF